MIDLSLFPLFLAGALVLNVTPGPDVAFTMATAAKGGTRAGMAAALGVGVGSLIWSALAALGLAAFLAASENALLVIRIAGACYFLYLAAKTVSALDDPDFIEAKGSSGALRGFRHGMVTNLLNPKVGLFFLAFLPAFTNAETGPVWRQTLILGAAFSTTGTLVLFAYAAGAGTLRARLAGSRRFRQVLGAVAATAFGALGLRLLLTRPS